MGTPLALSDWCSQHGIRFRIADFVLENGMPISSTRIRDNLAAGNIFKANQMLGYPFYIRGTVIRGRQLGRHIGFPTANIKPDRKIPISAGVYSGRCKLNDTSMIPCAINYGVRPTVDSDCHEQLLEAHLIDWQGDIYNQEIEIQFLSFIRPEKHFKNINELQSQIEDDLLDCRNRTST
jgi:riboflavin kinase/FMN adenylyltransferase